MALTEFNQARQAMLRAFDAALDAFPADQTLTMVDETSSAMWQLWALRHD